MKDKWEKLSKEKKTKQISEQTKLQNSYFEFLKKYF